MMVRLYRPGDAIQSLMEQVYAPGATQMLLEHTDFDPTRAWVAEADGQIQGFACCTGAFLACVVGACEELMDVVHQDAGFTGPVRPESTGRGDFAGIAVGPEFQGHGLGKLLFYRLLEAEKAVGAKYMTLFTGVDNHARWMYRKAGFREVRQFAVMEKVF